MHFKREWIKFINDANCICLGRWKVEIAERDSQMTFDKMLGENVFIGNVSKFDEKWTNSDRFLGFSIK